MLIYLSETTCYTFLNTQYYSTYPLTVYCKSNFSPTEYKKEPLIHAVASYNGYFSSYRNLRSGTINPYYIDIIMVDSSGAVKSSTSNIIKFRTNNQWEQIKTIDSGEYFMKVEEGIKQVTINSHIKSKVEPINIVIQNDGRYEDSFTISYSDISKMIKDIAILGGNNFSFDIIKELKNINFYGNENQLILNYVKDKYKVHGIDWVSLSNDIKKSISNHYRV